MQSSAVKRDKMAKSKFYVVWQGRETGIFTDWPTTQKLVAGYPGAKHKSFESRVEAEAAFAKGGGPAPRPQSATAGKPRVASTARCTGSPRRMTVMSRVPPPKSKTSTFCGLVSVVS